MLPENACQILTALCGSDDCFSLVRKPEGIVIESWSHPTIAQPTVEQVTAIATGKTPLPSGVTFAAWLEENGGDLRKTRRRKLRQAFRDAVDNDDVSAVGLRALIDIVADRISVPRATLRADVLQRMFQIAEQ